jgi:hypothetical protein
MQTGSATMYKNLVMSLSSLLWSHADRRDLAVCIRLLAVILPQRAV